MKLYRVLGVAFWMIFLTTNVFAFNAKDYPISTVQEATDRINNSVDNLKIVINDRLTFIIPPGSQFSIIAQYSGQERRISSERVTQIDYYTKAYFGKSTGNLFSTELLFIDSDGKEYWFPIQQTHLDSFQEEYLTNRPVKLYLIPATISYEKGKKNFLFMINEFAVQ